MRRPNLAIEPVGQPGVEKHLKQNRDRQQQNHQRLLHDLLALEAEQQHQRRQQRDQRGRAKDVQQSRQSRWTLGFQDAPRTTWAMISGMTMYSTTDRNRFPRHDDRGQSQQQADNRAEREHHDHVVQRHLA
jgi:hypothetical protein